MKKIVILPLVLVLLLTFGGITLADNTHFLPGTYEGEGLGYGGDVTVTLTVNETAITDLTVDGEHETPGIGQEALSVLCEQLIEVGGAEIDGVSGATVTASGVIEAAQIAFTLARGEKVEAVEFVLPAGVELEENEYFGSDPYGANGVISVKVTLDDDGTIIAIKVLEQSETRGLGTTAILKLLAAIVEENSIEVDSVSGATVSSNAFKRAVNRALKSAEVKAQLPAGVELAENEYFGSDPGANGVISVKVTLDENGTITAIKVLEQSETRGLGTTAILKLMDAIVAENSTEVDSIAGATITSNAFKRAVQQALESAKSTPVSDPKN